VCKTSKIRVTGVAPAGGVWTARRWPRNNGVLVWIAHGSEGGSAKRCLQNSGLWGVLRLAARVPRQAVWK